MIGFYVMSACWMVTILFWQKREAHHGKERMEMLKLFRAHNLSDYSAQEAPVQRQGNFLQTQIKNAYTNTHLLGHDDDD